MLILTVSVKIMGSKENELDSLSFYTNVHTLNTNFSKIIIYEKFMFNS